MSGDEDLDAGWDEEAEAPAAAPPRPTAAPETARFNPDRATLPPPMPEQEYIEKILATDDAARESAKPKRGRLNTLIESDPLQYDSVPHDGDAHQRPTRPPASAAASADEGFLDLRLDEEIGRRSSAPGPEPVIPPPPPAPSKLTPEPRARESSPDPLDELPIDAVLDSLSPESLRPAAPSASARPKAPPPPVVAAPSGAPPAKPRRPYDSSPSIEVVELAARPVAAPRRPAHPSPAGASAGAAPRAPATAAPTPGPSGSAKDATQRPAAPVARKTPKGTPAAASTGPGPKPAGSLSKTPLRVAAVKSSDLSEAARPSARPSGAATPPSGTQAATPPSGTKAVSSGLRSSKPPARRLSDQVERPTRAIRTPAQVVAVGQGSASEKALVKVAERFEAGDYGRALMLAEQVIELGEDADELRHYAELCREKLRQTYLERIGSGRTILRVSVSDEKLRERSLDPRLAFLLSLLDGASTVDDVVDMSTMPPLEAVRALHELLVEGVVEAAPLLRKAP